MKIIKKYKYIVVGFVLAFVVFSSSGIVQAIGETSYTVPVKKGWNLVYGDTPNEFYGENLVARYRWINPIEKNVLFYPESFTNFTDKEQKEIYSLTVEDENYLKELEGQLGDLGSFFEDDADWVFFSKADVLIFDLSATSLIDEIKLFKGWNTKTIMPWMAEKMVSDFRGSCAVEDVVIYDASKDSWESFVDNEFSKNMVWGGFAVKVADNCGFDFSK